MVRNDDKIGNYWVDVIARSNCVATFQCPTFEDAAIEANRIARQRRARGLATLRVTAQKLIVKKGRYWWFDSPIEIELSAD